MTSPQKQSNDPYAPPPRYREKSGAVVRVAILGALLAGAAWGYMQFANAPQTALVEPAAQEQVMAETSELNAPYQVQTQDAAPAATPASESRASPRPAPGAASGELLPPPTTTTEPTTPQPLPPVDMPAGE
ncbi:MAG: hypothetical protein J0L81_07455 [Caulobacterales bacterium]|nr:hypothetical protein [Caulobacterales bacterium]